MDDAFGCSDLDDGLGGDFHVTAHADFMFEGGDGDSVLGLKEVEVDLKDTFIEKLSEPVVFAFEFDDTGFQVGFFSFESGQEVFDFLPFLGVGLFRGGDLGGEGFEFLHEIELPIFEGCDGLFGCFDFVGEGGVFLVSSCLELLLLVARDGVALSAHLDFQVPLFEFDFFGSALGLVEPACGVGELLFARLPFFGQVGNFGLVASKALIAILQGEEPFDHIKHCQMMIGLAEIIQRAVSTMETACMTA
jgi:hypothetical protein